MGQACQEERCVQRRYRGLTLCAVAKDGGQAGAGGRGSAHGAASAAVHRGLGARVRFAPRARLPGENARILNVGAASTGALRRPRQASKRLRRSEVRRSGPSLKNVRGGGVGAGAKTGGRSFQPAAPPTDAPVASILAPTTSGITRTNEQST